MNHTTHCQPIITNARQGLPLSTLNRRKTRRGLATLAVVAVWVAVILAAVILAA